MEDLFTTFSRLIVAAVLGSIIGLERQRKGSGAGLRTHILVCVGSALIMLVSLYIYDTHKGQIALDPGRIAAGVVTGVGFLGAGTIIRSKEGIRGLTTAASVWVSSGIGLATGCGYLIGALSATAIVYISLSFLKQVERKLEG